MKGKFIINNRTIELEFESRSTLLDVLRNEDFIEVKKGCGEGICGSCLVLLEGKPVNACQVLAGSVLDKKITTTAGLGDIHNPHPIHEAFVEAGAIQCGFCSPAMILATYALLTTNSNPTDQEIVKALDGNLCRCTGYVKIIQAVKLAAQRMSDHDNI